RVEGGPAACRAPRATVDDEILGALRHLGIEVVHQHPERGFLLPAAARQCRPPRRANGARGIALGGRLRGGGHAALGSIASNSPRAIAAASVSMSGASTRSRVS